MITRQIIYLWFLGSLIFASIITIIIFINKGSLWIFFPATFFTLVATIPCMIILYFVVRKQWLSVKPLKYKTTVLYFTISMLGLFYGIITTPVSFLFSESYYISFSLAALPVLILFISFLIMGKVFKKIFTQNIPLNTHYSHNQLQLKMNNSQNNETFTNTVLVKAIITGVLILLLLIPAEFIKSLIKERQARQTNVVEEVSEKWAKAQQLSGPYIYLPYTVSGTGKDGKTYLSHHELLILPEKMKVDGTLENHIRKRSIYKVPLYSAHLNNSGTFKFSLPEEISTEQIKWTDARICFNISDFRGIEEEISINLNGKNLILEPGIPTKTIGSTGLSAKIPANSPEEVYDIEFAMKVKLKGSMNIEFLPLAGNSSFHLKSKWPNPSFSGNSLPNLREVNEDGFTAGWSFNKANLPFTTVMKDFTNFNNEELSFGVQLIQPADNYAKTERSIKYALLFIGLTISLFFIIELVQKTSLHPVQYILIGLALVIFYTLLLSISEYLEFNYAYLIAATAIVLLITFYSYSHFKSIRTTLIFFISLSALYAFTFMLINMEDMALLAGSVGLFIILAIAMYISRRINWYGSSAEPKPAEA